MATDNRIERIHGLKPEIILDRLPPDHWHQVLWPREDGDFKRLMPRLTTTHARRGHLHRYSVSDGHLDQDQTFDHISNANHRLVAAVLRGGGKDSRRNARLSLDVNMSMLQ